jgi:hypothetical protein
MAILNPFRMVSESIANWKKGPQEPLNEPMITGHQTNVTLDQAIGSLILDQRKHKIS